LSTGTIKNFNKKISNSNNKDLEPVNEDLDYDPGIMG
jgi:hypothetical protein